MVNSVVLVGRLGQDPKLTVTSGGVSLCKFSIAVDRPYKSQSGERETDWLDIVAWRDRAEFCANYLKKGSVVGVQGRIQVRKWETPEGEPRRMYEVLAENVQIVSSPRPAEGAPAPDDGDAPPSRAAGPSEPGAGRRQAQEAVGGDAGDAFDPIEDDDPFGSE